MACASCSQPLPAGARFCPFCGHAVAGPISEERRVVTVLFADLVGSTKLSEHLDPEQSKRLIDGALKRLVDDIREYGGSVDKVLGDGILALFGAPVAHEDDPDRAIRAALAMHASLADYVDRSEALDAPLQMRIGVNTGEVLVGSLAGTDEYTATGDVVNVASRLQAMADPGAVVIGDSTASLASDEIVRELIDDVVVRGREQTERVWRVVGRQPRLPAIASRSDLPFVGRETQRELFRSIMGGVAAGRSAIIAVTGEAGSGKTRLVTEMLEEFPDRSAAIVAGVCAPYGERNAWAPVATALYRQLAIDPAASAEEIRAVAGARVVERYHFDPDDPIVRQFVEAVVHLIGHPTELDTLGPARAREKVFRLLIAALRQRSASGPIIVWIDDLQWADPLLLDLLNLATRSLVDRPVMIVTAQRDDVELDWPPTEDHPITVRMPLDPLSPAESEQLVAALLRDTSSSTLAHQLYERSGGNPLYLTELAVLTCADSERVELPGSLRGLIAARLDRLAPAPRAVLDNAAVLGASGEVKSLQIFAEKLGQRFDDVDLGALVADGLLEVDGGSWRFRSDVVREVAYQTLTKVVRAVRHAGTSEVKAQIGLSPIDEVAHHAACAAELVGEIGSVRGVPRDIGERAASLLLEAARRSLDVGAFSQARRQATRALDLGSCDDSVVRELLLVRADASAGRRLPEPARLDAQEALEAALEAGDRRHEGIARRLLGGFEQTTGDLAAARRHLDLSVEIFRQLGDDRELAAALSERGFIEVFGGPLSDADRYLNEADELFERLGDGRGRGWVRQHQAWVAFLSADTDLAEQRLAEASAEFARLGDRDGEGWVRGLLAYVRFFQRRIDEAEELATLVSEEANKTGDRWAAAMMDALLASIRLWSGRFSEADHLSRRALHGFRALSDRFGIVLASAPGMRALAALGRTQEAERRIEEVMSLGEGYGDLSFPMMAAAGTAAHLGLAERAVTIGELAVARTEAMEADGSEARVTLALARCQTGRVDDALALLLDVDLSRPYARAVHALAAVLSGDHDSPPQDADAVIADPGATYLDRVFADVAGAAAEVHRGDTSAAAVRLERARDTAGRAGDVMASGFAAAATDSLLECHAPDEAFHLGPGWQRVIEGLCAEPA